LAVSSHIHHDPSTVGGYNFNNFQQQPPVSTNAPPTTTVAGSAPPPAYHWTEDGHSPPDPPSGEGDGTQDKSVAVSETSKEPKKGKATFSDSHN